MKSRSAKALARKGQQGTNSLAFTLCSPNGYCASVRGNSDAAIAVGGFAVFTAALIYVATRP